jgi:type II secretory pathway component GspD/PulD (secretin)
LKNKAGMPIARDIPMLGEVVSSHGLGDTVVELVILIRVRIIDSEHEQSSADTRLQKLVHDPRPFQLTHPN